MPDFACKHGELRYAAYNYCIYFAANMSDAKNVNAAAAAYRKPLKSYSGYYACSGELLFPENLVALCGIINIAREQKRKVGIRGEGFSFDAQGLNNDLLISLKNFNRIEVNAVARQVTVGAGAIWADILKATSPFNLIPAVMVSTGKASAGGTFSANCMSRFSPLLGKEGKWVESFTIVTADGLPKFCSRAENSDLFYAAIGGFGYLGAVIEITYNLYQVPENAKVKTIVVRKPNHAELYKDILPESIDRGTVYSAFGIVGERIRTMTCLVEYRTETRLKQMAPHRPDINFRLVTEFLIQWFPKMGQLFWNYAYSVYTCINDTYIDPIDEYTFFMDGNVRATKLGRKWGISFDALQQTFVIPATEQSLNFFLKETLRVLGKNDMPPAMIDALYLPKDEKFLLSSSYNISGYAVSMAFSSVNDSRFEKISEAMVELSEICMNLGGKVHLIKNVLTKPEHVQLMYKDSLPEFFAIKKKYDPTGLFSNDFIERVFADYV